MSERGRKKGKESGGQEGSGGGDGVGDGGKTSNLHVHSEGGKGLLFGQQGEGKSRAESVPSGSPPNLRNGAPVQSYRDKLLSPGCAGFLVKHSEEDDIMQGWKEYFHKMNEKEQHGDLEESDGEDSPTTRRLEGKPGKISFTAEEYTAWCLPWMNSLIIKRWRPNFNPWKADVQCNIAAWIRLPDVPFEFYNVESLRRIGNMIGKMIKVDRSTSVYDKGGFARICVEIDLKKPLIPTYLVFGEERPIIYEGLHQVCLMCGKYGHQKEGCPLNVCKATNPVSEQEKVEEVPVGDSSSKPKKDVNGKEGVEEGISSVSGVVGGNGGKSPEKDSISGGEPSTVSDGGQKIDESPFGKIKLLRRDFRRNLSGHLSEASVKKGIQENPVLAEVKGSTDGIRILRREQMKKEATPGLNENKKASTREKGPLSAEWVQVGSKRKGESKGKLKGKENKSKPKTRPSRESTVGHDLGPLNSNYYNVLQGMEAKEVVDVSPIPKVTGVNDAGPSMSMNEDVLIPPREALSVKDVVLGYNVGNAEFQGAKRFPALVRDLKSHYHLDFIAIVETRCAKESSVVRASQLGFSNMELIDCEGYSGGIWCLWNPSIASISVLERHHQFIHLQVNGTTGHSWTLTVVYASPSCISRRVLWDNLSRLAQSVQGAWLLGGDFNGTLLLCERRSNATFRRSIDQDFSRWVDTHDLRDMGFVGPEFTWKRGMSEARLDRILVNNHWNPSFGLKSPGQIGLCLGTGTLGTFMAVPIGGGSPSALRL
ncbi:hypothetical protein K1719_045486 [Acacia pycnantha]|nr:hypothetical protein K1719_045486 [Acacia pycnantha]